MPVDDSPGPRRVATTSMAAPVSDPAMDSRTGASLVMVHSPELAAVGGSLRTHGDVIAIGRDVDPPGLRVDDPLLSRLHFRIAYDARAGSHRIGDARSRNGTFVDGVRVESAVLRPGSIVRAGGCVFVYVCDDAMARVNERLERAAPSTLTILLMGETGTGKERLARAAHDRSGRGGSFIAVNCAALPKDLIAAELFGHTRGAFSGAGNARRGLFRAAAGGTLFLDEIAELPLDLQAVLLRVLQEGTVRPVGSDEELHVDVRVVAATHRRLTELVTSGRFRGDLYARLAQIVLEAPPLRERRAEVLPIARAVASALGAELRLGADAAEALVRYEWPFNVRELESLIRSFLATEPSSALEFGYLREHHGAITTGFRRSAEGHADNGQPPPEQHRDRSMLESLLLRHRGNISSAAEEIGKPRAQLYRWLRSFGLNPDRYRELD